MTDDELRLLAEGDELGPCGDVVLGLLDRLQAAEAAVERVREYADAGFNLTRPYGDLCETCRTPWQETGVNLAPLLPQARVTAPLSASGAESDHGGRGDGEGLG